MTYGSPFAPLQASTTAGKTVKLTANATPTSVAGTLDCTGFWANAILVTNGGTSAAGGDPGTGVVVFVRVSPEPQASIAATAADVPIAPGQSRVFQNPVANGKTGLAVLASGTTASDIFFTPGEGGS